MKLRHPHLVTLLVFLVGATAFSQNPSQAPNNRAEDVVKITTTADSG